MFAVEADVSNDRSTVAVPRAQRKEIMKPFEVPHTLTALLISLLDAAIKQPVYSLK